MELRVLRYFFDGRKGAKFYQSGRYWKSSTWRKKSSAILKAIPSR